MGAFTFMHHECSGAVAALAIDEAVDGLPAARAVAVKAARSIMAQEVAEGRLCLSCWIVVKNGSGHTVLTVQFGEAVRFTDHAICAHDVVTPGGAESPG